MTTSTITHKGQTTIPIQIRTYLNVHPGDKLEFFVDHDGRVVVAPLTTDVTQLKGCLPKPKRKVSVKEMSQVIKLRGAKHARD